MNIIWTYGYSDRPFRSSGNKKCFESNIDATTIECDIDQESRSEIHWKALPSMQKGHVCNCYVIILEWLQMTLFLTSTKMKWSYTSKIMLADLFKWIQSNYKLGLVRNSYAKHIC